MSTRSSSNWESLRDGSRLTVQSSSSGRDPVVERLRGQIAAVDVDLVDLVNRRLELVRELWAHKRTTSQPLRSPEREEWLLGHLLSSNRGPLSEAGVRRLHGLLLELVRSELE
jgi:chorismate mutase